jgi:lysozyme
MDLETLQDDIMREEGHLVLEPYQDHLGYWTIGCGHLIRDDEKEELMQPITEERAKQLFVQDFEVSKKDAETFYEGIDIDDNVKECVIHMSFQLGLPKLNQFKKFKKALQDNDIAEAIEQMKDSRAYKQTTNRWDRLIEKMRKSL